MYKYFSFSFLLAFILCFLGCADDSIDNLNLSPEEKDYVERFNTVAKDIRDFPPREKNIEKYFYAFKSVTNLEDAKIIFLGETHTHAANQLWSAALINRMIRQGDVVLLEGAQRGTPAGSLTEYFTTGIFAAREYEKSKSHKAYKATAIDKIRRKFLHLFFKTKAALALNLLNFEKGKGYFWDLTENYQLHPDIAKRNEEMVKAIDENLGRSGRIFVIAGALHLPHYEFASTIKNEEEFELLYPLLPHNFTTFLAQPGARRNEINDAYYRYWKGLAAPKWAKTESIFQFIKGKDFAVLIPKNLPRAQELETFFPINVQ